MSGSTLGCEPVEWGLLEKEAEDDEMAAAAMRSSLNGRSGECSENYARELEEEDECEGGEEALDSMAAVPKLDPSAINHAAGTVRNYKEAGDGVST
jgi:hypothetical protein